MRIEQVLGWELLNLLVLLSGLMIPAESGSIKPFLPLIYRHYYD